MNISAIDTGHVLAIVGGAISIILDLAIALIAWRLYVWLVHRGQVIDELHARITAIEKGGPSEK